MNLNLSLVGVYKIQEWKRQVSQIMHNVINCALAAIGMQHYYYSYS